jgi:hypothetical protein
VSARRWLTPALLAVALAALAATARWWLAPLLEFVRLNADLIQGLADAIQIVLWVGAAGSLAFGLWRGTRKQGLRESVTGTDSVIATRGGTAARQVAVGRDVYGDVIVVADPDLLWQAIRRRQKSHGPGSQGIARSRALAAL